MIEYKIGDILTDGIASPGAKMIAHIANNCGQWGAGFVVPLGEKYPGAKAEYERLSTYPMGFAQIVQAPGFEKLFISNIIGQDNTRGPDWKSDVPRVQWWAVREGLISSMMFCAAYGIPQVVMPRIGCGIGGGSWNDAEWVIGDAVNEIQEDGITAPMITVYTLPSDIHLYTPSVSV